LGGGVGGGKKELLGIRIMIESRQTELTKKDENKGPGRRKKGWLRKKPPDEDTQPKSRYQKGP